MHDTGVFWWTSGSALRSHPVTPAKFPISRRWASGGLWQRSVLYYRQYALLRQLTLYGVLIGMREERRGVDDWAGL
jgi:hypothetical protein